MYVMTIVMYLSILASLGLGFVLFANRRRKQWTFDTKRKMVYVALYLVALTASAVLAATSMIMRQFWVYPVGEGMIIFILIAITLHLKKAGKL